MKNLIVLSACALSIGLNVTRPTFADTLSPANTFHGIKGTEALKAVKNNKLNCFLSDKYVVQIIPNSPSVGEDIHVFDRKTEIKSESLCSPKLHNKIIFIKNLDSTSFAGIHNTLLFVDNGTGPTGRSIEVYDLSKKNKIYSTEYTGELKLEKGISLSFLKPTIKDKSIKKCPNKKIKGEMNRFQLVEPMKINLMMNKEEKTGKAFCVVTQ